MSTHVRSLSKESKVSTFYDWTIIASDGNVVVIASNDGYAVSANSTNAFSADEVYAFGAAVPQSLLYINEVYA